MKTYILMLFFSAILCKTAIAEFIGYRIDDQQKKASFNFELVNNLIVIPVIVNDSIPLKFILDTGVRTTLLTSEPMDQLDILPNREVIIAGLGTNQEIKANIATNVSIKLPGITGKGQTLIILNAMHLDLQSHLGMEVHGILGYDFFNHFVVEIRYDKKKITVYEPKTFHPSRKSTKHKLYLNNGRPYIEGTMLQEDASSPISVMLLIDTGASHSLMLEQDKDDRIQLPEKTLHTIVGWGLGGELLGEIGRLKHFSIDQFDFKDILVSYISGLKNTTIINGQKRTGSIGGEIMSRFNVAFDYPSSTLYLKKNHQFKRRFEYNLSGLDIIAHGPGYKTFEVVHVASNTPAESAGMAVGDIIISIDGKGAAEMDLDGINSFFRSKQGSFVNIIVLRKGNLQQFKFKLKRLV